MEKDERIYFNQMLKLINNNYQSFYINYIHFKNAQPTLALWLGLEPSILIPELNAILYNHICKNFKNFKAIIPEVYVRFEGLPIYDRIR